MRQRKGPQTKRRPTAEDLQAEATRARLIAVAKRLFAEHGYPHALRAAIFDGSTPAACAAEAKAQIAMLLAGARLDRARG